MNPVLKRILTGLTVSTVVVLAILFAPIRLFRPVCLLLTVLAAVEVYQLAAIKARTLKAGKKSPLAAYAVGGLFVALVAMMFNVLASVAETHGSVIFLYLVAIVKFSDTGGFAFGLSAAKYLEGGSHKLCPSISPNKSWEGLLGSIVFSAAVSAAFIPVTHFCLTKALIFGVAAALLGTFGDLVESKFKRWVGVKDSSTMAITNGMGGFLDMFDSLVFAPAVLLPFL